MLLSIHTNTESGVSRSLNEFGGDVALDVICIVVKVESVFWCCFWVDKEKGAKNQILEDSLTESGSGLLMFMKYHLAGR